MTTLTITRSRSSCAQNAHRTDFKTCPHCEHEMESEKWDRCATILVLSIVQGKHGSLAVVSECPKCFEKSWVHHAISLFSYGIWPDEWGQAAEKEQNARQLTAAREWAKSKCAHCRKLQTIRIDTSAYRTCAIGTGPSTEECDSFAPLRTK